jgi:23S rRNA pseudouridine2605 synthase
MTGLLLLTNDAELRKKISQAKALRMIYKVILDKNIDTDSLKKLKEGVRVFDKEYKIAGISHIEGKSKNEIGVEVDGLNPAILVKLFASVDRKVLQVDRVVIGGLTKKELPRGTWRRLTVKEVSFLKMLQ